jgi:hypothetical protein
MDTREIIQTIDAEIARLEKVRVLLNGDSTFAARSLERSHISKPASTPKAQKRRKISAEGRARIAAAQKARWAKAKRG